MPVLAADQWQWRHPIQGISVLGDLTHQPVGVSPLRPCGRQVHLARVYVDELRHALARRLVRTVLRAAPVVFWATVPSLVLLGRSDLLLNPLVEVKRCLDFAASPLSATASLEDQRPVAEQLAEQTLLQD